MAKQERPGATSEREKTQKYALLSVSDKTGIVDLARTLDSLGFRIISTGGTAKALTDAGLGVIPIEDVTGNPESFDRRMKTISFQVESGILYDRTNPSHVQQAKDLGIKSIDLVVCNLYPFEKTVGGPDSTFDQAVESIDVGGPTMVRAAAKNHKNVLVVVDPADYKKIAETLTTGSVTNELRQELAAKAFRHLSFYDAQIGEFLGNGEMYPEEIALPGRRSITLRYGENPHQTATVYFEPGTDSPLTKLNRLGGKELGYVNFFDIAAGLESVRMFDEPCAVVIKHNTPSGIALGNSYYEAIIRAVEGDGQSAFGGIMVVNGPIGIEEARAFAEFKKGSGVLMDVLAATSVTDEAVEFLLKLRKNQTGIYSFGEIPQKRSNQRHIRHFDGGFVMQDWDDDPEGSFDNWNPVTIKKFTPEQTRLGQFGWKVIGRVRSNTVIVIDKEIPMTRGIGSGQTSRVLSTEIALKRAGPHTKGGILVSDSFFPFGDSVKLAAKRGIAAIVQQGGSNRDNASIEAANKAGVAMVFTGKRAFWH